MKDARKGCRIDPGHSDWMQMVANHHRGSQSDGQTTQQSQKDTFDGSGDLRAACVGSSPGRLGNSLR